uniref:Adhesion G protein-coupled receptor D2 n=1 Tax=Pelusios castaneus TaxID=367368 RepID=A0A8C8RLW7_9SAUR
WWHANRYCEQRFAQLFLGPRDRELASVSKLLRSHKVRSSVWLDERETSLRKWKQRRIHRAPILVFRNKTDTKYVKVLADFPMMPAVTACAHIQWDNKTQEISTIFSYAVPAFINEFQLRGFVDEEGFVRFAVIVHGHHSPYLPVFRSDRRWHHVCVTWHQQNGTWAIYTDGKKKASAAGLCTTGPSASQAIYGGGIFIIGQDQDSLGGTFKEKESFSGNITDLSVWRRVLSEEQIERVRCENVLFVWGTACFIESLCVYPGPVEECSILEVGSGGVDYTSCLRSLPFICHYKKGTASVVCLLWPLWVPRRSWPGPDVNLSAAVNALRALTTVLREEETSVEPADLLGVVQFLKQISDVGVQEPEEREMVERLSQYYVEVTGLILEEQNTEKWSEISQVKLAYDTCMNLPAFPDTGGAWSTAGCSTITSQLESTACFCNHTTNFAVLLQLYEVQRSSEEESTLRTLTFIGCGISFCALIVTFILFLAVGVPKSERTTVHKNLIFALAAAEALLMFSELAKTNEAVCFAVTAFLHLFFMAAFSWMLVEGLLLWSKVVAVNMSEERRMKFYYVTGWGLPVVIVGVTMATSFKKYVADNHCWLNVQTDTIWAFVGPVLFVLTVNTFVLFRVVMVTVSSARRRSKMLTPSSSGEDPRSPLKSNGENKEWSYLL